MQMRLTETRTMKAEIRAILRNGMCHDLRNGILMRNVTYAE